MASTKSVQLRNITRPRPKLLHKSWEAVRDKASGDIIGVRRFGPPYRNPARPPRKAAVLAKRRAAKDRARQNGHRG